jgi:hypothetical protein
MPWARPVSLSPRRRLHRQHCAAAPALDCVAAIDAEGRIVEFDPAARMAATSLSTASASLVQVGLTDDAPDLLVGFKHAGGGSAEACVSTRRNSADGTGIERCLEADQPQRGRGAGRRS